MGIRRSLSYCLLAASLLEGCDRSTQKVVELSDLLNEESSVVEHTYTPAHAIVVPTIKFDDDDIIIVNEIEDVPDHYQISFNKVEDHIFVQEGSENKHKNLYNKLSQGDKVKVYFKKRYMTTYDLTKAEKQLSKKELISYEFIDAEKISN